MAARRTFNSSPLEIAQGKLKSAQGKLATINDAKSKGYAGDTDTGAAKFLKTYQAPAPVGSNAFTSELQKRLLGQADIISSSDTALDKLFSEQIRSVGKGLEATTARLESQRDREVAFARGEQGAQITQHQEGQRGFAVQMPALRRLVETTDKEIKDLDQRFQELILQGESDAAGQIRQIQSDLIQYKVKAQQDVFDNLLGLGNFSRGLQQDEMQAQRFARQDAQSRVDSLRDSGVLGSMSDDERSALEAESGLPAGSLKAMSEVPPNYEIRSVGDMLVAIDPKTLKTTVLYNGATGGGGVSVGGTNVSYLTSAVIEGIQSMSDLTATERQKVMGDLAKLGFDNDTPPSWFVDKESKKMRISTTPELQQDNWQSYKLETLTGSKRFLSKDFFSSILGSSLGDKASENDVSPGDYLSGLESTVQAYRQAGFTDQDILKLMQ